MLTENSSAFAFLLSQMANKIPQEELPSLVSHSVDAMDEFLLITACLNRIAFYTDFDAIPEGGKMLATVNCALSDLGYMVGDLNRCWESVESIQAMKQQKLSTPIQGKKHPHSGVKKSIGGDK